MENMSRGLTPKLVNIRQRLSNWKFNWVSMKTHNLWPSISLYVGTYINMIVPTSDGPLIICIYVINTICNIAGSKNTFWVWLEYKPLDQF